MNKSNEQNPPSFLTSVLLMVLFIDLLQPEVRSHRNSGDAKDNLYEFPASFHLLKNKEIIFDFL